MASVTGWLLQDAASCFLLPSCKDRGKQSLYPAVSRGCYPFGSLTSTNVHFPNLEGKSKNAGSCGSLVSSDGAPNEGKDR